jgi:hypothetical protein
MFFNDLGVFIEHSDGEKIFEKGTVVDCEKGILGLKFRTNKFSDFTIVKLNQDTKAGWKLTNGSWYFINNDGTMSTVWQKSNGKWYYLYNDGSMASNTTIHGYQIDGSGAWIE